MTRGFTVLTADTDAARVAIKGAGCTHAVINVNWNAFQPSATGTTDATAAGALTAAYAHALSIGLKPILSINIHYPPTWVLSGVEKFTDQSGNDYTDTNVGLGKAVRNWMWTANGRTYVADFIARVAAVLGPTNVGLTDGCRVGGGWYGELHYPQAVSGGPTFAWQGFGASMQSGTGIASDLTVCPIPGYTPFTGTDAQDCLFLNWYLNGLVTWALWLLNQHKAAGFTRNLFLMLPGYGVRLNQLRTSTGYKQAAALGEDHVRAIGAIMNDPAVWPYSTWLNTADGFVGGTVDSDKSAWKSLYEKSLARGKHYNLWGENTGNESDSGMDGIFSGALGSASYAGYPGAPPEGHYFASIAWLNYASLTAGGANATMAHYATKIAATT
jgi:hypothetical protein